MPSLCTQQAFVIAYCVGIGCIPYYYQVAGHLIPEPVGNLPPVATFAAAPPVSGAASQQVWNTVTDIPITVPPSPPWWLRSDDAAPPHP
jgi:hypothetical protein